jgi:hypothetical protein
MDKPFCPHAHILELPTSELSPFGDCLFQTVKLCARFRKCCNQKRMEISEDRTTGDGTFVFTQLSFGDSRRKRLPRPSCYASRPSSAEPCVCFDLPGNELPFREGDEFSGVTHLEAKRCVNNSTSGNWFHDWPLLEVYARGYLSMVQSDQFAQRRN